MHSHDKALDDRFLPIELEICPSCPLCGCQKRTKQIEAVEDWFFRCIAGNFDFERCDDCGSLYLNERLTPKDLPEAYSHYYTHFEPDDNHVGDPIRKFFRKSYASWRFGAGLNFVGFLGALAARALGRSLDNLHTSYRFAPPAPAKILDYGCGNGGYLNLMRSLGFDVVGVDFDPVVIAALRENEFVAFTPAEAANQDWNEHFDHITLAHVIEHVFDPVATLQELNDWLKPGGKLFVEVPHAKAHGIQLFNRYWRGLEAPRHLSIPTLEGLCIAASEAGFKLDKSVIRDGVRSWLWSESLHAAPTDRHLELRRVMETAPPESSDNAEFLTLVFRKASM